MKTIDLRELLEAGCHFGHEVRRWHPKAAPYIYSCRDRIHIIDLLKTKEALSKSMEYVKKLGLEGKTLLFVGTKRQAKTIIQSEAKRIGAAYFYQRWVGGFITNWTEIKKNIDKVNTMDEDKKTGKWLKFPKHEQLKLDRSRMKLEKLYGGVKHLTKLPDALYIVDIRKEATVVAECFINNLPVVGIVDTNSDPTKITYPIPANDDAVKSITIITQYIASAYEEGLLEFKKREEARSKKAFVKPGRVLPPDVQPEAEKVIITPPVKTKEEKPKKIVKKKTSKKLVKPPSQ